MAEGGREGNMQVGDGGISNTVEVRGFLKKTSQELMEMYFENSRRSGGGDVEEVRISDEVAYITFKEAEVAQKVASRSNHQVDGHTLTVTLFHPLPPKPCYQNRVLIQGVHNAITEELLRNFMETKTKAEVTEFLYGEEDGNVVVTLSDNIDIVQLGKIFQESSIQGVFLKAARVSISNCILVQNLHPSTSHDVILYYFENKRRSGGGDVERVEMKTEERYCLIYFEDPSVIDRVLGRQSHNVDGVDFEIHLHHECLGRRSSRKKSDLYLRMSSPGNKDNATLEDENTDNQANDKTSSSVSSNPERESDFVEDKTSSCVSSNPEKESDFVEDKTSSCVSRNPEKESDFVEVQEWQANDGNNCTLPLCIKYKRAPDKKIIKCMKNIPCSWNFHLYWSFYTKTEPGKQMLHEIINNYNCSVAVFAEDEDFFLFEITENIFEQESDVVQLIHVVLDSAHKCAQQFLYLDNILVDQRIQGDVLQVVKQRKELDIARFELIGQQDFDVLCFICTEKDQTLVHHAVTEIIHMIKEYFENHEEIIDVDHKWQKVMKTFGYLQKLCEKYPNVTITDKTEAAIMIKGPRDQSKSAADHFVELLGTASSEVQEEIFSPGCQFEIFTYPEVCGYIDNIAMEHSIVWIPNQKTKKIHLFSKMSEKKKGVDKFIRGCVQERLYPLAKDQTVFSTKMFRSLEEFKKMHTGKMVFSSSYKGLLLTATDDIFESIDDAVQEIICKETENECGIARHDVKKKVSTAEENREEKYLETMTEKNSEMEGAACAIPGEIGSEKDSPEKSHKESRVYLKVKAEVEKGILDFIRHTTGEEGVCVLVKDLKQKADVEASKSKVIISLNDFHDANSIKTCVIKHYREAKKSQDAIKKRLIDGGNADTKEFLQFAYSNKGWDKKLTFEEGNLYLMGTLKLKEEVDAAVKTVNQWCQDELLLTIDEEKKAAETLSLVKKEFPAVFIKQTGNTITIKGDNADSFEKAKIRAKIALGRIKLTSRKKRRNLQADGESFPSLLEDDRMEASPASLPSDWQTSQNRAVISSKTFYTREGITVKVYTGDIVRLPVDCIVNVANKHLSHGGGVALAIAKAAGRKFDQESEEYVRNHGIIPVTQCCVTSAGRLPYKYVIHVVGPQWHDYNLNEKDKCAHDLKKTVINCLSEANKLNMTSIAVSSISSGIFGVPKNMCAQMYVDGVVEFSRTCILQQIRLREIHFVDMLPEMCHLIQLAFDAELNTKSNNEPMIDTIQSQRKELSLRRQELPPIKTQNEVSATEIRLSNAEAEYYGSKQNPYVIKPWDHTRILIYNHDITDVNVDAIVCPVFPSLEGGVAKSVKRACGSEYADRDYKYVMDRVRNVGEIRVTSTPASKPTLPFHHIIHIYSPRWTETTDKENFHRQLKGSVKEILNEVMAMGIASVALPILGIGDTTTPVKLLCEYIMDGIATVCSEPHMVHVSQMTIHLVTNETSLTHQMKEIACQQFGQKIDVSSPDNLKVTIKNYSEFIVSHNEPPSNHLDGSKRGHENQTETCPICLDTPVDPKAFNGCGHILCRECMEFTMKNKPVCTVCGKIYGIIMGNQPVGIMHVSIYSSSLPGFKSCGTIDILYNFPGGIQTEGHPNPGQRYYGTSRRAYLPDNTEGRKVLSLLKKAFDRRLVFTIGRSVTTGRENTVTWNGIHHKTHTDGGPQNFGYPDPDYLRRVREELAAQGVTEDT